MYVLISRRRVIFIGEFEFMASAKVIHQLSLGHFLVTGSPLLTIYSAGRFKNMAAPLVVIALTLCKLFRGASRQDSNTIILIDSGRAAGRTKRRSFTVHKLLLSLFCFFSAFCGLAGGGRGWGGTRGAAHTVPLPSTQIGGHLGPPRPLPPARVTTITRVFSGSWSPSS